MARAGAQNRNSPRLHHLPKIPLSTLKSKLNIATMALWKDEWQLNLKTKWPHRQTKQWLPAPSASKAKQLMKNDRLMWSRKIATISLYFVIPTSIELLSKLYELKVNTFTRWLPLFHNTTPQPSLTTPPCTLKCSDQI